MKRLLLALTGCITLVVSSLMLMTTAHATQNQICGNAGSGYCLNDWGGGDFIGDPIKMDTGGGTNEDFYYGPLTTMCGHGKVTSSCPFDTTTLNDDFLGLPIFTIYYGPGGCAAGNASGQSVIGDCPSTAGVGGSDGTIYVQQSDGLGVIDYSRQWTNYYGSPSALESGGNVGVQANELCTGSTCTIWNT